LSFHGRSYLSGDAGCDDLPQGDLADNGWIVAPQTITKITEEEYLRLERAAEGKSEFINGKIFPVSGGTIWHALIGMNFGAALVFQSRSRGFRVLSSDARVRTSASGSYVYPDVSVVRGTPLTHQSAADNLINPTVIVEVLSPSTANFDGGKKFQLYREIASLEDYVLVYTDAPLIEHFARQPDASWTFREYRGLESSVSLSLQSARPCN